RGRAGRRGRGHGAHRAEPCRQRAASCRGAAGGRRRPGSWGRDRTAADGGGRRCALERGLTLLWLTTHDESEACRFYEGLGYVKLGVMPDYSQLPHGTLAPGALYFKRLAAD